MTQQQIETIIAQALSNAGVSNENQFNVLQDVQPQLTTLFATDTALINQNIRTWTKFNNIDDVVTNVVQKVSTPLWSDSTSSLSSFYTSSTQSGSAAGQYYLDVYHKEVSQQGSAVQFSVTYGHQAGSGSGVGTNDNKPYKAIYSQFSQLLLSQGDTTWTFKDTGASPHFYALTVTRGRYKDRIDPANWELHLSGSVGTVKLIDDSGQSTTSPVTGSSRVYNIVSGTVADGVFNTADVHKYGYIYPDMGVFIFDAEHVSQSIGMSHNWTGGALQYSSLINSKAHEDFLQQIQNGNTFTARSEEDVTSTHYFCRLHNNEYNYSNNKTWATGSDGVPTNPGFTTDPKTYITSVGLYNDARELLAVAKLSQPLLKSFSKESVIKIKLDF